QHALTRKREDHLRATGRAGDGAPRRLFPDDQGNFGLPPVRAKCYKPAMSAKLAIGFLGAGKMATAPARGFVPAQLVTPKQIIASDPIPAARTAFGKDTGAKVTSTNTEVVGFANVLILAVKPDQVAGVLSEVRDEFTSKHLLISIAAGVTLAKLESLLGAD